MDNNIKALLPDDRVLCQYPAQAAMTAEKTQKTGIGLILQFINRQSGVCQPGISRMWLAIIAILSIMPKAQSQTMDYAVQANIIYRFTKYIDWPEGKKSGDFVIGIVGETPLYAQLKSFASNKTAGNQKIVVMRFSSSAATYNCQILFISEDESSSLKKIAARTAGSAILLVSESEGLAQKGACINFVIVSEHLKLEINKNNIEQRNLNIASELVQLGIAIK
jgi:hypothetical protein